MGLTNFVVTVAAVGAVILLARSDVKQSAAIFKRNVRHIRSWLEEESSSASKSIEKSVEKAKSKASEFQKKDGPDGSK